MSSIFVGLQFDKQTHLPKSTFRISVTGKILFRGRSSRAKERNIIYTPAQLGYGWVWGYKGCTSRYLHARGTFKNSRRYCTWKKKRSGPSTPSDVVRTVNN